MEKKILMLAFVFLLCFSFVLAENETINQTDNQTIEEDTNLSSVLITKFFPFEVKIGDVQLSIKVLNNKSEKLENLFAFVTGYGFSTYNIISAEIEAGEEDYIFVTGNFRQAGNITLRIIIEDEYFYENVSVVDTSENQEKEEEIRKQQENAELLQNISAQFNELKINYTVLENILGEKKEEDYDVSKVNLDILASYMRGVQANLLTGNAEAAKVNFELALDEYSSQKTKLDNSKTISIIQKIKNNAVLFSTIAGAIIAFFTLYELLKRKSSFVAQKVSKKSKKK